MAKHVIDIIFSAVLFIGAITLWLVADGFPQFERYQNVDSDFWPKALMVLIAVLASILLIQSIQALRLHRLRQSLAGLEGAEGASPGEGPKDEVGLKRLAFAAVLTIGYVVALRYTGFLISTVIFLAVAQNIVSYSNFWMKVVFPFAFTGLLAVLFVKVMALSLPRGTGLFYQMNLLFY